eukprot:TRINITY_DN14461_c0_g1_i1.p1 TRINITY_DN14461_c0_g1~~TRINITY_DN14461_c0_g1_i1.p1  ORF type:complete len:149 (+),score=26.31 TRINITY_DN14461_c0_g1_i1:70-516(+)
MSNNNQKKEHNIENIEEVLQEKLTSLADSAQSIRSKVASLMETANSAKIEQENNHNMLDYDPNVIVEDDQQNALVLRTDTQVLLQYEEKLLQFQKLKEEETQHLRHRIKSLEQKIDHNSINYFSLGAVFGVIVILLSRYCSGWIRQLV